MPRMRTAIACLTCKRMFFPFCQRAAQGPQKYCSLTCKRITKNRPVIHQPTDKPYRFIPLTKGQIAIVDLDDFARLSRWNWCATWAKNTQSYYAQRGESGGKVSISMHSAITGFERTDHKNGNTLDNRRENLRDCSATENARNRKRAKNNTSGYKGVSFHKEIGKWQSYVGANPKKYLGYFLTAKDAARAYDAKAKELHGEFAHLNFPPMANENRNP